MADPPRPGPFDVTPGAKMAEGVGAIAELMTPVLEVVTGYRAKCIAAGFSASAADRMAADLHSVLMPHIADIILSRARRDQGV